MVPEEVAIIAECMAEGTGWEWNDMIPGAYKFLEELKERGFEVRRVDQ